MKTKTLLTLGGAIACLRTLAGADLQTEVEAATNWLFQQSGYTWRTTTEATSRTGSLATVVTTGQTEKHGPTVVLCLLQDFNLLTVFADGKSAVRLDEKWATPAELQPGGLMTGLASVPGSLGNSARKALALDVLAATQTQEGRQRLIAWRLMQAGRDVLVPTAVLAELVHDLENWRADGDAILADLTEGGAAEFLSTLSDQASQSHGGGASSQFVWKAHGTAHFWLGHGQLKKVQVALEGTRELKPRPTLLGLGRASPPQPAPVVFTRISTIEFSDVGRTVVRVPPGAAEKLGLVIAGGK